jgi:predicted phage-related endonuclease
MLASGVREAHVAAILGGTDFAIFPVEWDERLATMLVEAGGAWWRKYIVEGHEPEPDGSDAMRAYLAAKYPKPVRDVLLDATPEQNMDAAAWLDLYDRERDAKARRECLTQHFIAAIGAAAGIVGDAWVATYKGPTKRAFRLRRKGINVTGGASDE